MNNDRTEKKYLIKIIVLILLLALLALLYYLVGYLHISENAERYIKQGLTAASLVISFVTLRLLYKYYILDGIKFVAEKVSKKIKEIVRFVSGKISSLMTRLGLGRRKNLAVGKDEYSFTFDEDGKDKTKLHVGSVSKWKDLRDNNQRLRFLFIRYMLRRIRKGYRKRRGKTPLEWARDLKVRDDALELFFSYNMARYSGGREQVSDGALERAKELCERKRL